MPAAVARIVARYTRPEIMSAYLTDPSAHVLTRLVAAEHAAAVIANPRGRFGLESKDTAHMVDLVEVIRINTAAEAAPVIAGIVSMRAEGHAYDTVRRHLGLGGVEVALSRWAN